MVSVMAVELSCAALTVREINQALRQLPDGTSVRLTEVRGQQQDIERMSKRAAVSPRALS